MQEAEVRKVLAIMAGYWPSPTPTQDEVLVLTATLIQYERAESEVAIRLLLVQGRTFRPSPAELTVVLRSVRRRALEAVPSLPSAPPAEKPLEWVAEARQTLAHTRVRKVPHRG